MTKEEMSQLQSLRKEIRELEDRIRELESSQGIMVSDKVQASSEGFPYCPISVKIEGYSIEQNRKVKNRIHDKKTLLAIRRRQAEDMEIRITEYINSVQDSRLRRIMEYRYVEGYTWERIGRLVHCDRTTAEKAVAKYLQENP